MDEGPLSHQGVPGEVYHTLGKKTLLIFLLTHIHSSVVFLLLSIGLFAIKDQPFLTAAPKPFNMLGPYFTIVAWGSFALFALIFLVTFFIVWLIYVNYKFCLADNALKIKRGILNKEEVAIPYRQIQDVNLNRDLSFQMMGLSRIVILTAGHEEVEDGSEAEGILPALDKDLAEWLQAELLQRANVQKVQEEK